MGLTWILGTSTLQLQLIYSYSRAVDSNISAVGQGGEPHITVVPH